MALLADNDVVVHQDAETLGRRHDLLGHLDIGRQLERPLHHLAHIDRGVIDGALLLHLVGDDLVALVEEQDAELT